MGTPDFAVDSLNSINKSSHNLCCVVTIPDKKVGRGQKIRKSAVKNHCISNRNIGFCTCLKDQCLRKP